MDQGGVGDEPEGLPLGGVVRGGEDGVGHDPRNDYAQGDNPFEPGPRPVAFGQSRDPFPDEYDCDRQVALEGEVSELFPLPPDVALGYSPQGEEGNEELEDGY